ncbi:MAG: heparan-alpha-glucosaminide N-acetyltransferase domain-containing protein, partial [Peptoniphilus harei]|nr:heparan-alpha-glucosaminide N-acetyltransferase domain-containing protein [Peptoniphilus harei]
MDTTKKRYNAIDFLRGFTIINMIIFHGLFDLENFY